MAPLGINVHQELVVAGHAQQGQADDQHAGDRAAPEGDVQGMGHAGEGCLGGAHVAAHGHVHADVAGQGRAHGADDKTNRHPFTQGEKQQDEDHRAHHGHGFILPVQEGIGAFPHRRRDFLHPAAEPASCFSTQVVVNKP